MNQRLIWAALCCLLLLPCSAAPLAAQSSAAPLCFEVPGVVDCIDGRFRPYWTANGGLAVFGYPLTPALPEETADGLWTTQQFERNRLEVHPDAPAPFTVQLGRLGADRLAQLGRDWRAEPNRVERLGCKHFAATGRSVCEPFLSYWRTHGLDLGDPGVSEREALALWGLPLTAVQAEANSSNDTVPTQWFERARFEDHGAEGVLLGRLGAEVAEGQKPAPPAAGWVMIQGDQLIQNGQAIRLKGVNYYPAQHPWAMMWLHWDAPQVERDLVRLRREVGANVVRVLVPYGSAHGWSDDRGNVSDVMLDRLLQFVQLAGHNNLKVIVTLFDWHGMLDTRPATRQAELGYLRRIITALRDDDRVLAWDIHNEPDHYEDWKSSPRQVVAWLAAMRDAIRALDARHPITIGVGQGASLYQAGPDGRTILDLSDLVSVHSYDAANYRTLLSGIRQRTSKPILLEEFGWPSGPECVLPHHDEPSQLYLFRQARAALDLPGVVGGLSWWLQDQPISPWEPIETENTYFGLYRRDGSAKPALGVVRAWHVAALPSLATSALALTSVPPRAIDALETPIFFDEFMLYGSFLHFWKFFGGEATFGRPLTQPYRDAQGMVVQYFEHARFELNESEHVKPIDPRWPEGQTPEVYLDRVHLTPLGQQLTAGRSFAPGTVPPANSGLFFAETGHSVQGAFRDVWLTQGEIFWGLPISEQIIETVDGEVRTVQYFTKWRMERGADGSVRPGRLGHTALAQRPCLRGW